MKWNFLHHYSHSTSHFLFISCKEVKTQLMSKFFDRFSLENPNKSYPSIVSYHLMTLEYSIISQQIIYSFDIGIFWLLNLVK